MDATTQTTRERLADIETELRQPPKTNLIEEMRKQFQIKKDLQAIEEYELRKRSEPLVAVVPEAA